MKCTIPILMAAAFAVYGCSAQAARGPVPAASSASAATSAGAPMIKLDGTDWRFVEVGGHPVPAGVTATMRFKAGRISGKAGCNAYGATYQIKLDGAAHFQQGMSTKMACLTPAGAMQVEHGVFAAFRETVKIEVRASQLLMLDVEGKPVAKLRHADLD